MLSRMYPTTRCPYQYKQSHLAMDVLVDVSSRGMTLVLCDSLMLGPSGDGTNQIAALAKTGDRGHIIVRRFLGTLKKSLTASKQQKSGGR